MGGRGVMFSLNPTEEGRWTGASNTSKCDWQTGVTSDTAKIGVAVSTIKSPADPC